MGKLATGMVVIALCACMGSQLAHAEVTPQDEYNKRLKISQTISPGGETPFGERINLYTGELSFSQTDLVYEGIGPAIVVTRTTATSQEDKSLDPPAFGIWDLSIPRIETLVMAPGEVGEKWGSSANGHARCSQFAAPPAAYDAWWHGMELVTEDGERRPLLKRASGYAGTPAIVLGGQPVVFTGITTDNWQIGCLDSTANGQVGEAFLAVSPGGTKYWLNYLIGRPAEPVREMDIGGEWITTRRTFATMYVTRIEDRSGNWLDYSYAGNKLSSISGSDGRVVSLAWRSDAPVIQSITQQPGSSPARTWQYQYSNVSSGGAYLKAVVQPDGSQWSFSGAVALDGTPTDATLNGMGSCSVRDSSGFMQQPNIYTATIIAPSGSIGTFDRKTVWHGRSYVFSECVDDINGTPPYEAIPPVFGSYALVKRAFSGPGMPDSTWTYAYSPAIGSTLSDACVASGCQSTAYIDITDPGHNRTRHTYSTRAGAPNPKRWMPDEGRPTRIDFYQGASTPLRSETFEYAAPDAGPYPAQIGSSLVGGSSNTTKLETWTPLKKKQFAQQDETFTWTATTFDSFARPLSVNRDSSLSAMRTDTTTYHDNFAAWVLGQVASVTCVAPVECKPSWSPNGIVQSQTTYNAQDLPAKTYAYGKLQSTLTYYPDGTVKTSSDGNAHATTFSNWYRGIPRLVTNADATTQSAVVNAHGWITSVTDESNATTAYGYDAMGRVNKITYPTGDTSAWSATTIAFAAVGSAEYGIAANHWRQTVSTGNSRTITYYDALWRPVLVRQYDTGDVAGTSRFTATAYDPSGQVSLSAYPVATSPAMANGDWSLPGVRNSYDALGRVTSTRQDSELGVLTTATAYLGGFQTRVTDPRGNATTTRYVAYDQPTIDQPWLIDAPENTRTTINRDVFGKPMSIARGATP